MTIQNISFTLQYEREIQRQEMLRKAEEERRLEQELLQQQQQQQQLTLQQQQSRKSEELSRFQRHKTFFLLYQQSKK